jgi:hypothetical protein
LKSAAGHRKSAGQARTHLVVAGAEDELGLGVLVNDALDNLALVDGERPDLKVLLADEDLYRPTGGESALKQVVALLALERAEVGIRLAVVPSDRGLLELDVAARRALRARRQERTSARAHTVRLADTRRTSV